MPGTADKSPRVPNIAEKMGFSRKRKKHKKEIMKAQEMAFDLAGHVFSRRLAEGLSDMTMSEYFRHCCMSKGIFVESGQEHLLYKEALDLFTQAFEKVISINDENPERFFKSQDYADMVENEKLHKELGII